MDVIFELPQQLWEFLKDPGTLTFGTVVFIATAVACLRIFSKAKTAWWKALIPVYNVWTLTKICYGTGFFSLLYLIPLVNLVYYVFMCRRLCRVFGKGLLFTLGLIFIEPLFILILGFGGAKYRGPVKTR